ncbi:glycosyltransferase family 2 protein [Anaerotardibacter muris]|uniref:glycosyltransferase family 2 protein n=1 Tax=Anaerotardibacter muris TaxID=2941505 RepID=UPI002040A1D7|nr:glycosyltransferase [Anaerotardibacter muris]
MSSAKSESPAVSVLVPICNVEKYLRRCLKSLVRQTLEDIEIICINDGSTDGSAEVIAEFAAVDPRIKVITKPNSGYGDSMNKGLALASGEFIAIVESDDFIDEDGLERMVVLAQENNADVVKVNFYTHVSGQDFHEDPVLPNLEHCPLGVVFDPRDQQDIFLTQPAIWSALYRRSFLEKNAISFLPTSGASFQDTSFNFKVFACAKRVYLSDEACLHYRIDNSNSSVKSLQKVFCICDEYSEMWRFLEERGLLDTLGTRLTQVQYGGYHWNLERLTPNLRYEFFERFVEDFCTIKQRGFLDLSLFDEGLRRDIAEMLESPEAFFRKHYGPIEVQTTYIVDLMDVDARSLQKKASTILGMIGEDDELICLYNTYDPALVGAVKAASEADARIVDGADFLASVTLKSFEAAQIRSKELCAIECGDLSRSAARSLRSQLAQKHTEVCVEGFVVTRGYRYDVASLQDASLPLVVPLLALGFYANFERVKKSDGYWREVIQHSTHFSSPGAPALPGDYLEAKRTFNALIEWAFSYRAVIEDTALLKGIYQQILVGLWAELLGLFDGLSYNDRARLAPKPSTLDYPAIEVAPGRFAGPEQEHSANDREVDVSVIIPVYNAGEYLLTCLESALGQEDLNIQVICIDDGSSDGSLSIIEEIAQVDDRIRAYLELNGGAGAARNRGIEIAQGRYLAFIDPDDLYPSNNTLAHLYAAALANDAKMCGGSFTAFLPEGKDRSIYYGDETPYTIREEGFRTIEQEQFDYGWIRFIYAKELFEEGLRFPLYRWYEDPVFFVRANMLAKRYYVIPEPTYYYREDYKQPSWNAVKIRDMLAGIAHNAAFAKQHDLNDLYGRLIYRIDYDYGEAILSQMDDEEVLDRMAGLQAGLEIERVAYLREKGYLAYILKPLYYRVCAERKTAVRRLAEKVDHSRFYEALQARYERYRKR